MGNIHCGNSLNDYHSRNEKFTVHCPADCFWQSHSVVGTYVYRAGSSICLAAIHNGSLTNDGGDLLVVVVHGVKKEFKRGSTQNGISSESAGIAEDRGFYVRKLENSSSVETTSDATSTRPVAAATEIAREKEELKGFVSDLKSISTVAATLKTVSTTTTTTVPTTTTKFTTMSATNQKYKLESVTATKQQIKVASSSPRSPGIAELVEDITESTPKNITKEKNQPINTGVDDIEAASSPIFETALEKAFIGLTFLFGCVAGIFAVLFIRRKRKFVRRKKNRNKRSKMKNTDSTVDEEACVCYQTLDSSSQGLLFDRETCERPCSIRKAEAAENNILNEIGETNKSFNRQSKCEIRYDEECKTRCQGTCNQGQFDF